MSVCVCVYNGREDKRRTENERDTESETPLDWWRSRAECAWCAHACREGRKEWSDVVVDNDGDDDNEEEEDDDDDGGESSVL